MSRFSRHVTGRRPTLDWVERGLYVAALLLLGIWTTSTWKATVES